MKENYKNKKIKNKILFQDTINNDLYQLIESIETEFANDDLIMEVYKNKKEIDIDSELENLLIEFKTCNLSVGEMCKFIKFYNKFNELRI